MDSELLAERTNERAVAAETPTVSLPQLDTFFMQSAAISPSVVLNRWEETYSGSEGENTTRKICRIKKMTSKNHVRPWIVHKSSKKG